MKVIKINDGCYVQAHAILSIQEAMGLSHNASAEVRAEWEKNLDESDDETTSMLLPTLKILLVGEQVVMLYFGSVQAQKERLTELVEQWRGGECE